MTSRAAWSSGLGWVIANTRKVRHRLGTATAPSSLYGPLAATRGPRRNHASGLPRADAVGPRSAQLDRPRRGDLDAGQAGKQGAHEARALDVQAVGGEQVAVRQRAARLQ